MRIEFNTVKGGHLWFNLVDGCSIRYTFKIVIRTSPLRPDGQEPNDNIRTGVMCGLATKAFLKDYDENQLLDDVNEIIEHVVGKHNRVQQLEYEWR